MKKSIYIFFSLIMILSLVSCSEDYNGISNSGEVKIKTFSANAKLETLDETSGLIELVFPSTTDLTKIKPVITLSEGAHIVSPENPEGPIDLSKVTVYRVVNGNLYHDYNVVASHVSDKTKILTFSIGKYKGVIDQSTRTITVLYPKGEDVTALTPKFTITDGAKVVSPTATTLDFTSPVNYNISYLDETFIYKVTVVPTDLTPVGFLGEAATAGEITNLDEKAAWNWLSENFVDPVYISFDAIKKGADLSKYGVLWYHCDPDKLEIPSIATDATVIDALKKFHAQGGGLLLTSAGVSLGTSLDIAKNGKLWNNDWGYGNSPSTLGENWGMRFTGHENHPIFKGLRMEIGETSRFYIMGKGVKVKGHNAIWNFDTWTGYNFDVAKWQNENGGKQLASFYWDDAMNQRSIITEYERQNGNGATITIAVESYDWYNEDGSPVNSYHDNLETLTGNILNYLAK